MSNNPANVAQNGTLLLTPAFTKALPKIELHAHLSGSINRQCLHKIWQKRKTGDPDFDLADPLVAMPLDTVDYDINTFFPLFSTHIYNLINDIPSIQHSTHSVLQGFADDGVTYLELRTTPRAIPSGSITKDLYISTILDVIHDFSQTSPLRTYLILSIDRRNTPHEALEVVDLACRHRTHGSKPAILGIDLCGDPSKGDVSSFREAFSQARSHNLKTTIHFAEIPASSTRTELETLLSFQPDRLGHVIHVPEDLRAEIARRGLGLELCLSCNVHAKMIQGGFGDHHFGYWREKYGHIILGTDDVGIFASPLSNEYLLAAQHFKLSRDDLIELSMNATRDIFAPESVKEVLRDEILTFSRAVDSGEWRDGGDGGGVVHGAGLEQQDEAGE